MKMKMKLKILITGCNRGIGRGIAETFLELGYEVIGLNKSKSDIDNLNFKEFICDVSDYDNLNLVFTKLSEERIDVVIANAGIRKFNNIENLSVKDWDLSVKTNLSGVFYLAKLSLKKLRESCGMFVAIGSHAEKYPFQEGSVYCSSKGGVRQFIDSFIEEERYNGIRASYLSIGSVKNRNKGGDESWKLKPSNIGKCIENLVCLPKNVLVPYLDIRPLKPKKRDRSIEFLQQV